MCSEEIKSRIEYLRQQVREENIGYSEVMELQDLAEHIEPDDVELLEWAGVPEYEELTDTQKLDAIETFLQWDITSESVAMEALDNIWYVVMEGRLKNE